MVEKSESKKKLPIKKRYIILLIILGWVFLKDPLICASGMREFRFECYSTAEEIQEALYKLHPKGSDLGSLEKTLKNSGAINYGFNSEDKINFDGTFEYKQGFMAWYGWNVYVNCNFDKNIIEIKPYERKQGITEL